MKKTKEVVMCQNDGYSYVESSRYVISYAVSDWSTEAEMCRYECVTYFTIRDLNQDETMANIVCL
jgi:hypothetical protein